MTTISIHDIATAESSSGEGIEADFYSVVRVEAENQVTLNLFFWEIEQVEKLQAALEESRKEFEKWNAKK
jgi:hypothetical protein